LLVFFKLDFGFDGRNWSHVEIDVGNRFVVFLWHVGCEVREGMDGPVSGDEDIWSCHDVGENFRLLDFIQDFIDLH
jgi:hypothetical protein